jgi:hypothetical protein
MGVFSSRQFLLDVGIYTCVRHFVPPRLLWIFLCSQASGTISGILKFLRTVLLCEGVFCGQGLVLP